MIFRVSSTSTVTVTLCTQIEGCDWNQLYLITVAGDKVSLADAKKTVNRTSPTPLPPVCVLTKIFIAIYNIETESMGNIRYHFIYMIKFSLKASRIYDATTFY